MSSAATFEPRVVWEPRSLAQHEFLTCPAYECLFEGRRFCGKTDALLMDYAQHVGAGWGEVWRGAVFRKTYDQLQDVIAKSLRWFPRIFPTAKYNQASHFWKWPDGERLFFRSIADPRDYERFHGWELPWVGWEELTNWPSPECYQRMKSVNRAPVKGVVKKCRATTNPWGVGNGWVRRRFVEPSISSRIYTDETDGLTRARVTGEIIPELVENDPEYYQRLKSIPDPQLRKAWLEGRWDVVIGGMFDDLWDESVHVVEPFKIPKRWRKDRSLDWGSASPFSVLWWAEANGESVEIRGHPTDVPRGTLFLFAEWYGEKADDPGKGLRLQARAVAKGIQEYERRMAGHLYEGSVSGGPADTAIWSEESDGANIADRFAAEGVRWTKANKRPGSRIQGVEAMRDRLESTAMRPRERPGLHVFDSCRSWLAHVPILQRDEKNPDDVDTDQEDHDWDATMYRLLERRHTRRVRDLPQ